MRANELPAFARQLVKEMSDRGLSAYALAHLAGLTPQSVRYLAAGKREPSWETVQRIAQALGLDVRIFADANLTIPKAGPQPPGPKVAKGRPPKAVPGTPPAEDLQAEESKSHGKGAMPRTPKRGRGTKDKVRTDNAS
jgi:transcriptional regulator with XRE-family HTH domain